MNAVSGPASCELRQRRTTRRSAKLTAGRGRGGMGGTEDKEETGRTAGPGAGAGPHQRRQTNRSFVLSFSSLPSPGLPRFLVGPSVSERALRCADPGAADCRAHGELAGACPAARLAASPLLAFAGPPASDDPGAPCRSIIARSRFPAALPSRPPLLGCCADRSAYGCRAFGGRDELEDLSARGALLLASVSFRLASGLVAPGPGLVR